MVDYRQLRYKDLLYLKYLDTKRLFSILDSLCPHDLVRIVIKYPGIDSYQIKRKKYPLRITQFTKSSGSFTTMATILLQ